MNKVCRGEVIEKEDLSLEDHLVGKKRKLIKLSFDNNQQMREGQEKVDEYILDARKFRGTQEEKTYSLMLLKAQDERIEHWIYGKLEYDVSYMNRISIDKDIRCGNWFDIDYPQQIVYEDKKEGGKIEV